MTPPGGPTTIPGALAVAAARWPDEEAIVDGGVRRTFRELHERSQEVAAALLANGIAPGDRVALWAPNSEAWVAASFGIYQVGAVLVPLNSRYKGSEAHHVLATSEAKLLIGVTDLLGTDLLAQLADQPPLEHLGATVVLAGPDRPGTVGWQELLDSGRGVDRAEVDARTAAVGPDDVSDIIFTSGTTGAAKGAVLAHGPSVRTYLAWSDAVGLRHDDRYLTIYPFFHTAGLKSSVLACVLVGATLVPHAVFDPEVVMRSVEEERVTVLPGPPTVFQAILDAPRRAQFDLTSVRLSVTGAAVVPVSVIERMRSELRIDSVVTGYGLTETTGTVSMCRHTDPPDTVARTVGRPLGGVEVRIIDDGRDVTATGAPGEIQVRGFNVMQGYFNAPEATAEAITPDGWLRTGDIGLFEDGNLRVTDRLKDMFIVGGFNAYPAEIEAQMLAHPWVAQVAVVGVPDARLGEVGVAFVLPAAGAVVDEAELIAWCKATMANFKVPRRIHVVDSFPLNATGKVQKFVLRATAGP